MGKLGELIESDSFLRGIMWELQRLADYYTFHLTKTGVNEYTIWIKFL